jgi:Asp-tRNA(Asn)/Glu-tRNA(Gln) amidotransferase A subunit family amidase
MHPAKLAEQLRYAVLAVPATGAAMSISNPQVSVTELSIADIHARFAQGLLTCTELTQRLLQRIERYDKQGPGLNALLTVSPHALESARQKDREYNSNPAAVGPLHGIPVIVKDNYNTVDLPTTGGSVVLAHSQPPQDCFVVQQLRKAGALMLAKANLTELAMGGTTRSSFGGQTRNPYDVLRTPGGSSGGTAAAIAANFGIIGTGSDTGQSIRSPASACNLVGIRPTRGLVSRSGILPISTTQDEAGPITRSVADAARMLDVIAVYDPDDPITAFGRRQRPRSYVSFLDRDGLRGARLGLLTDLLGTEVIHEEVNVAVHHAIQLMEQLGATVRRLSMPCLTTLTAGLGVERFEFREAFNRYLARLGPDAPVKNLTEFLADGRCHPSIKSRLEMYAAVEDGTRSAEYKNQWCRREALRQAVMTVLADNDLDAVLYPHQKRLVAGIGEEQLERNGVLSHGTGFPAITFPGGFSRPTRNAPLGVPIGLELLGPEWSEPHLIRLAYAFEQVTQLRRPPASTPE